MPGLQQNTPNSIDCEYSNQKLHWPLWLMMWHVWMNRLNYGYKYCWSNIVQLSKQTLRQKNVIAQNGSIRILSETIAIVNSTVIYTLPIFPLFLSFSVSLANHLSHALLVCIPTQFHWSSHLTRHIVQSRYMLHRFEWNYFHFGLFMMWKCLTTRRTLCELLIIFNLSIVYSHASSY